jgi:hypothetical protein
LEGTSTFSLESTYLSVECGRFNQTPYPGKVISGTDDPWESKTDRRNTHWDIMRTIAPGEIWYNKSAESNPFEKTSFFMDTTSPWLTNQSFVGPRTSMARLDGFFGNINQTSLDDKEFQMNRELLYVSLYKTIIDDAWEYGLNIASCSLRQNHVRKPQLQNLTSANLMRCPYEGACI